MNNLSAFLFESSICIFLLYSVYWAIFRNDTFFKRNRFLLISILFLSIIIPQLNFSHSSTYLTESLNQYSHYNSDKFFLIETSIEKINFIEETINGKQVSNIFLLIYISGFILLFIRFLHGMFRISTLIQNKSVLHYNGIRIVDHQNINSPFSFFNTIFINKSKYSREEVQKIYAHEKVHIRQMHIIDLLLVELFIIIFWFNPFIWLLKNSLRQPMKIWLTKE